MLTGTRPGLGLMHIVEVGSVGGETTEQSQKMVKKKSEGEGGSTVLQYTPSRLK